jgi:hypothetical protein
LKRDSWVRRSSAFIVSLCLHVLTLLLLQSEQLPRMDLVAPRDLLPVSIVEPKPKPVVPPPVQQAPPPPAVEPAPPAPETAVEEAEPEPPPPPPEEKPKQAIPLPEQQIVEPSEAGEEIPPPPDTRLLSDRDNTVAEQMVRRGEPAQQEGEEASEPEPPAPPQAKTGGDGGGSEQLAALPNLDQLLPDALKLAGEGYGESPGDQGVQQDSKKTERPPRRFENVWLPTSKDIGTLDFLPDVREGDITLLNTKAELFAPFVRRVAVRVFQNLLILLRRDLPNFAGTVEETVALEAIMTRDGELASLNIKERSSAQSIGSGRMLQQACRQGFFDRNPPAGAESDDGQIHFLLQSHILAVGDGRGVRYGYRVAFQAGLR